MPYVEVPIEGSGTREDPYRAKLRVSKKSAVIPSNPDGSPKYTTALVWVDPEFDTEIDRSIPRIARNQARDLLKQLDPTANPDRVEQKRELQSTRDR